MAKRNLGDRKDEIVQNYRQLTKAIKSEHKSVNQVVANNVNKYLDRHGIDHRGVINASTISQWINRDLDETKLRWIEKAMLWNVGTLIGDTPTQVTAILTIKTQGLPDLSQQSASTNLVRWLKDDAGYKDNFERVFLVTGDSDLIIRLRLSQVYEVSDLVKEITSRDECVYCRTSIVIETLD